MDRFAHWILWEQCNKVMRAAPAKLSQHPPSQKHAVLLRPAAKRTISAWLHHQIHKHGGCFDLTAVEQLERFHGICSLIFPSDVPPERFLHEKAKIWYLLKCSYQLVWREGLWLQDVRIISHLLVSRQSNRMSGPQNEKYWVIRTLHVCLFSFLSAPHGNK